MPWGRLDDRLYDHPKLDALGRLRLSGVGLWALCISWSNRHLTDGLIPRKRIALLGGTIRVADALVDAGLFDSTTEGYFVHDFLSFNRSRQEVEDDRRTARERMTVVRANRDGSSQDVRSTSRAGPVPSRPIRTTSLVPKVVDERDWTEEQRQAAYVASQTKRTGVQ